MNPLSSDNFKFLQALAANNNREWFQKHRKAYEASKDEVAAFADEVLMEMKKYDVLSTPSGKKSMYRIFRDIRFSKDKTPFKTHWSGYFQRAGQERRGGYYFQIQPGNSFIGGGFWGPNKEDLLLIRQQIEGDSSPLRTVLASNEFKDYFGELMGDQLKTAPKGFDKESPDIDLLRYKQFIVMHNFTDKEVMSDEFPAMVAAGFSKLIPFFDVMSEYLTNDLNGESII